MKGLILSGGRGTRLRPLPSRLEGNVIIERHAIAEHSVIRGPVIVGARARILNGFVGPSTSIMNDDIREIRW